MTILDSFAGLEIGSWKVLEAANAAGSRWRCQCECGIERVFTTDELADLPVCVCGRASFPERTLHGLTYSPEYAAWRDVKTKCSNPNSLKWSRYGGRGVECHYKRFKDFWDDVGPRPSEKHVLTRVDPAGHFEPGNVEWALEKRPTERLSDPAPHRFYWRGKWRDG